jgi:hypothetical protein
MQVFNFIRSPSTICKVKCMRLARHRPHTRHSRNALAAAGEGPEQAIWTKGTLRGKSYNGG